jgi:hypothetical protein
VRAFWAPDSPHIRRSCPRRSAPLVRRLPRAQPPRLKAAP